MNIQNKVDAYKYYECLKEYDNCVNLNSKNIINENMNENKKQCAINKVDKRKDKIDINKCEDIHKRCKNFKNKLISSMKKDVSYNIKSNWSIPQAQPPICIPRKKCPVCPQKSKGVSNNLRLMEINDQFNINWEDGNKIDKSHIILETKWTPEKNPINAYQPSICPFDDCKPCNEE